MASNEETPLSFYEWREYIKKELVGMHELENHEYIKRFGSHETPINYNPPKVVRGDFNKILNENNR